MTVSTTPNLTGASAGSLHLCHGRLTSLPWVQTSAGEFGARRVAPQQHLGDRSILAWLAPVARISDVAPSKQRCRLSTVEEARKLAKRPDPFDDSERKVLAHDYRNGGTMGSVEECYRAKTPLSMAMQQRAEQVMPAGETRRASITPVLIGDRKG